MPAPLSLLALAPADLAGTKDNLAKHVQAILLINGYTDAIKAAVFPNVWQANTPPEPAPPTYAELLSILQAARDHVKPWDDTLETEIAATIPQRVVAYGERFLVGTEEILGILNSTPNPTPAEAQAIAEQLTWIGRHLDDDHARYEPLQKLFGTFQSNCALDYQAFANGSSDLQKLINELDTRDKGLASDINNLNNEISADRSAITAAALAGGVGLFVGGAVAALTSLTGFGAIIGIGIMVGSVAEMATVIAIYSEKLKGAQADLDTKTAEQQAVELLEGAIKGLQLTVNGINAQNEAMAKSLTEIANWWADLQAKLATLADDIRDAQEDTLKQSWKILADDVRAAQAAWKDYADWAQQMQDVTTGALKNTFFITSTGTKAA